MVRVDALSLPPAPLPPLPPTSTCGRIGGGQGGGGGVGGVGAVWLPEAAAEEVGGAGAGGEVEVEEALDEASSRRRRSRRERGAVRRAAAAAAAEERRSGRIVAWGMWGAALCSCLLVWRRCRCTCVMRVYVAHLRPIRKVEPAPLPARAACWVGDGWDRVS